MCFYQWRGIFPSPRYSYQEGPVEKSIPVWFIEDTVSNLKVNAGDMFDIVKEDLFPRSLMSATMQDGGTRERRDLLHLIYNNTLIDIADLFNLSLSYSI